jgi:sarcosine oxidase
VPSFRAPGPKVGQDAGGPEIPGPEARGNDRDPAALERVARLVEERLPSAGPVRVVQACTYTMPPDRDFVLDRVPGHSNVLLALGAGHGFKFAAWFGKAIADLAIDGETDADLRPFAWDRPALTEANHPKRFLL